MDQAKLQYINQLLDIRNMLNDASMYQEEQLSGNNYDGDIENILNAAGALNRELESFGVDVDAYFQQKGLIINGEKVSQEGE